MLLHHWPGKHIVSDKLDKEWENFSNNVESSDHDESKGDVDKADNESTLFSDGLHESDTDDSRRRRKASQY